MLESPRPRQQNFIKLLFSFLSANINIFVERTEPQNLNRKIVKKVNDKILKVIDSIAFFKNG